MDKIRLYVKDSLLIVEEIGHLPIAQGGSDLFFHRVVICYEKGAMILGPNRGFAEIGSSRRRLRCYDSALGQTSTQ